MRQTKRLKKYLLILILFSISSHSYSKWYCPQILKVNPDQTLLEKPPTGFELFIHRFRHIFRLENVSFYNGHPRNLATLRIGAECKTSWCRKPGDSTDYWIVCSYSDTSIHLTKRIPKSIKNCDLKTDKNQSFKGHSAISGLHCW